jgi:hypothetical protein
MDIEEKGIRTLGRHCYAVKFLIDCVFTCESWDSRLVKRVEALPCEESLEAIVFWFLCLAPLRLGGIRGKKSTPSIGWEVPGEVSVIRK